MQLASGNSGLLLDKAEQAALVVVIVNVAFAERAAVAFKELLLSTFNEEQLDVAVDSLAAIGSADAE